MLDTQQWLGLSCVLMRMTGCILLNPILGRRNFPALFRAGMILVFTLTVTAYTSPNVEGSGEFFSTCFTLLSELFIGYVIGFILSLFTYTVIFAGEFLDMQMGLSMAKIYDPQNGLSMSLSASYFNMMFVFLFFASNGHLTLVHLMLTSAEIVPYGQLALGGQAAEAVLDVFILCSELAVKMVLPLVAIQFLMEIGVGILMKAIPQINVFIVNLQAKILLGFVSIILLYAPLSNFVSNLVTQYFDVLYSVLSLV